MALRMNKAVSRPFGSSLRAPAIRTGLRNRVVVRPQASAKAAEALVKAKERYTSGDRLQAMKLYEDALNEDPTPEQRLNALYGVMAVHAAFGDIELAKMTLREAVSLGLDYDAAVQNPENPELVASPQMIIQLRRFSVSVKNSIEQRRAAAQASPSSKKAAADPRDIDSIIGSAGSEQAEVDTSIPGIIKRVLLVLLACVGLGVGLFYLGLEYAFPKI